MVIAIVKGVLETYELLLLGRVLLSYFPLSPGSPLQGVMSFLYAVTEPVLAPIRRVIPPIGGMGLDLSPMIVFFVIYLLVSRL